MVSGHSFQGTPTPTGTLKTFVCNFWVYVSVFRFPFIVAFVFIPDVAMNMCGNCGTEILNFYNSSAVTELYQMIENSLSAMNILVKEEKHRKALTVCESVLNDVQETLHCLNYQVLRIVDKASDICIEMGHWHKALDYCRKSILGYKKFYPKYHPSLGLQLYRIGEINKSILTLSLSNLVLIPCMAFFSPGKLQLHLDMVEAGFSTLSQAKEVLDICHGKKHPFTLQLDKLLFQVAQEKQFLSAGQPHGAPYRI